jgi:hypothetical protein
VVWHVLTSMTGCLLLTERKYSVTGWHAPTRRVAARSDDERGYRYVAFASLSIATGSHGYGMCRAYEGPERRRASKGRNKQLLRSR